MLKQRAPDWHETNLALFGSEIEKNIKAAAADGEPQWDDAGVKVGLQIWRIEQFKVKPWPKAKYGKFHTGDSYIILNTYVKDPAVNPDKLEWDVHFWIGNESTQDEYGTAAYKTVELDDKLGGAAIQHREIQENESALFLGYFKRGLEYLSGGVATGFKQVEAEVREPSLLMVKGRGANILLKEVECKRSSMNSGDVFILDCEEGVYQWNGSSSNAFERQKASEFCSSIRGDRGSVAYETFEEGDPRCDDASHPFHKHLPGEWKMMGITMGEIKVKDQAKGGDDEVQIAFDLLHQLRITSLQPHAPLLNTLLAYNVAQKVQAFTPMLLRLREGGKISKVSSGKPPIDKLQTSGVFVLDTGFMLYLWVGKSAPAPEKISAFVYAQRYLKKYDRPKVLPITRYAEGQEASTFKDLFGPAAGEGCCCTVS